MLSMMNSYKQKKMGASGAVSKGVGGYRPTINWRDITIRKKNVADKQVLSCIVISGIVVIAVGIILTVLGFLVIASQCPFEWVEKSGSCYYFAQHNASWDNGNDFCEGQDSTLVDILSDNEKNFILGKMVGRSWLGLDRQIGDTEFKWASGNKLNFSQVTAPVTMGNAATSRECGVLEEDGTWIVSGCDEAGGAFVICEYVPGYNPFMLIGPVIIICGVAILLLSIEVCMRRREFLENNPEVMINDDDERQVDAGLVNYGYGNFEEDDAPVSTKKGFPTKTVSWPPGDSSSPNKTPKHDVQKHGPSSSGVRQVTPVEDTGSGPRVHVVPASIPNSPSLANPIPSEDNTQSQEQLELLLSPKTLE